MRRDLQPIELPFKICGEVSHTRKRIILVSKPEVKILYIRSNKH
jgi:hypothetical protein